jgi:hypothetical protein
VLLIDKTSPASAWNVENKMILLCPGNTRLVVPFTKLPSESLKLSSGIVPTDTTKEQSGLSDSNPSTLTVAPTRKDTEALTDKGKGKTAVEVGERLRRDVRVPVA